MKRQVESIVTEAYKYNDFLISFANRYTKNLEDAKDVVQNSYLALAKSNLVKEKINKKTFGGYLRKLVYWEYKMFMNGREMCEELPTHLSYTPTDRNEDIKFCNEVLKKTLLTLPEMFRETLRMHYEGYTPEQIANRTENVNTEAIRMRIKKYEPIMDLRLKNYAAQFVF